ncbi:hypothetical protein M9458_037274, partial [Cirrhinus mrigala]
VQDSTSARRPSGSTMAPSSLLSAVARQSTDSTGLPRPSGSALGCRHPSCASGLLWLHQAPPSLGSTLVLGCSSSTAASWSSALPPPWLLPLSVLPWVAIMAVAWVPPGSSCSKSLLFPSGLPWSLLSSPWVLLFPLWLLPLSSLPRTHPPVRHPPPECPSSYVRTLD